MNREDITAMTLRPSPVPTVPGSALATPPNAEREEGFGASQVKVAELRFIPALAAAGAVDLPFRPGDTRVNVRLPR